MRRGEADNGTRNRKRPLADSVLRHVTDKFFTHGHLGSALDNTFMLVLDITLHILSETMNGSNLHMLCFFFGCFVFVAVFGE